jgi:pyrophosphatase PpaX
MAEIKALLLDIDGTVLDTSEFIFQATEYALAQNGYPQVSRQKIAHSVGKTFEEYYQSMLGTDIVNAEALQASHRIFQLEHLDLSAPYPGSVDTLTELEKRGYKLAAITNRFRLSLMPTLDQAGMTHIFHEIIAPDDAPALKPDPTPLFIALERFGLVPEEAAMVGDTDIDMEAGKRANVAKTVRATYGFHFGKEDVKADINIDDISELLRLFP